MSLTDLNKRIERLHEAAANGAPTESFLLREPILVVSPNGTSNPGVNVTYHVVLESRRAGIFKPFGGQKPNLCKAFNQDLFDAVTHEVAAWRLAHALGGQYEQLLPAAVLRNIDEVGPGVLINWRDGKPNVAVLQAAEAQARPAAFWDALVGQQDRHATNFRYDSQSRRLALIDHAFSFARPDDMLNDSFFLKWRRMSQGGATVQPAEREALERLLDSENLLGLSTFLTQDRVEALANRAQKMLDSKVLPLPGNF